MGCPAARRGRHVRRRCSRWAASVTQQGRGGADDGQIRPLPLGLHAQVGTHGLEGDLHLPTAQEPPQQLRHRQGGVGAEQSLGGLGPLQVLQEHPVQAYRGLAGVVPQGLLADAFAERIKFKAFLVFVVFWSTLVYAPIAHWVWGGGWLHTALDPAPMDFVGGNVVHMSSGVGALAAALIIGRRAGYRRVPMEPHSLMLVLLGTGLLWFGWFGFNGGSALAADGIAVNALVTPTPPPQGP